MKHKKSQQRTVASDPVTVPSRHLRVGRRSCPRGGAPGGESVPDDCPPGDGNVSDLEDVFFSSRFRSFAAVVAVAVAVRREERPRPPLVHAGQGAAGHAPRGLVVRVRRPQRAEGPHAPPDDRGRGRPFPADERAAEPAAGGVREQDDARVRGVGEGRLLDGALREVEVPAVGLV